MSVQAPRLLRLAALVSLVAATGPAFASPVHRSAPAPARHRTGAASAAHRSLPLAGKVVGIDPGHNGDNYTDPSFLNHPIFNGRAQEACDTTGTETDGGYTEAEFNFNVARFLSHDLAAEGAKVVLTRTSNHGIGPCVTTRAQIINRAHADVAIDIHADGGPASGRGFAILTPVSDGPNDAIVTPSARLARLLLSTFRDRTGMPISTYDGVGGLQPRDDLAGLNLATEPKVLIECGNMRNATDAALLTSTTFQARAAAGLAAGITRFLEASRT